LRKTVKQSPRRKSRNSRELTADSHISLTIKQALVALGLIATIAGGYYYLVNTQSSQGHDIAEIKATVGNVTQTTEATARDQDAKREQMGKEFLASTEKIAEKVSELNTAMAVQQTTNKQMSDTLTTISNQLGELSLGKKPSVH
jgi:hypothetical protein